MTTTAAPANTALLLYVSAPKGSVIVSDYMQTVGMLTPAEARDLAAELLRGAALAEQFNPAIDW
jgi:hypothetical protein